MANLIGLDGRRLGSKVAEIELTRDDIKVVTDFEAWCARRGFRFSLWCKVCEQAGDPDGVRGNNESTDTQYVIECAHRRMVYKNPAGGLKTH